MKYHHITISGLPGGGSTTLLKLLKEKLEPLGWKGFSGGEFMRSYALELGKFQEKSGIHHDSSHYDEDFDRQVDMSMRQKLTSEKHWILESWLSGFMAQGVPGVLKVLVYCSDDAVRIDRIVNRDNVTVEEAKGNIQKRTHNNISKWSRMYAKEWTEWVVQKGRATTGEPINFWKESLYDVCIDTYSTNKEETLQTVLRNIGFSEHDQQPLLTVA